MVPNMCIRVHKHYTHINHTQDKLNWTLSILHFLMLLKVDIFNECPKMFLIFEATAYVYDHWK